MQKYQNAARFCEALGIKYPIIQSPMAGISTPQLAAAVTSNGGLGSLPLATVDLRNGLQDLNKTIDAYAKQLTVPFDARTVNLNFFCHEILEPPSTSQISNLAKLYSSILPGSLKGNVATAADASRINGNISFKQLERDHPDIIEALFDNWNASKSLAPKIVSFHFGIPSQSTICSFHRLGTLVFATATCLEEATLLIDNMIDGIVLQGYEAGGHRGHFVHNDEKDEKLTTKNLFEVVQENIQQMSKTPYLVAAGGIMTPEDIKYYLDRGASAVQLGTAFLCTPESNSNHFLRNLVDSKQQPLPETVMVSKVSGRSARAVRTEFITALLNSSMKNSELPPYGHLYNAYKTLKKNGGYGGTDIGFYLAGSNYAKINTLLNSGEIVAQLGKSIVQ